MHHSPSVPSRTHRLLATSAIIGVTAALAACAPAAPAEDEHRTLTLAVGGLHQPHDPAQGGLWYDAPETHAVFETLGYWDFESSSIVPVLAESFEIAPDAMSMEVTLRDDVEYVDGTHLDAEGAVAVLEYYMASEKYELKGAVAKYEPSFEVTGEYTFEITTVIPIYVPISFGILLQTPIVSPAAIDDPASIADAAIGSGAYVIDEFVPDVEMTLVRNPDYRDPDAYPFDELVLTVIADPVAKLNALKSGQVDAAELTVPLAEEAEAAGFTIHRTSRSYVYLGVQDPVASPIEALRDVRVREAIMRAFDREAIADTVFRGLAEPAFQPYLPSQAEYVEGGDDRYPYDVERARELMAEAGYADGFDVVLPSSGGDIEPIVQQSLAEIGIRATYEVATDSAFAALIDGRHPLVLNGQIYGNTTRLLDEEFVGLGRFFFPTPEVVELLGVVRGPDPDAAAAASDELGEHLLDELWIMPIVSTATLWATIPEVAIDSDPAWVLLLEDFGLAE